MYSYSQQSSKNLGTCHVDLQKIFHHVIKVFDCTILEGHRGATKQNQYFTEGKTKLKYPKSKHNQSPSMAVDVVPYPVDWKDTDRMKHFSGVVKGIASIMYYQKTIKHLVRWGGDWDNDTQLKDNKFQDFPHYELYEPDPQ